MIAHLKGILLTKSTTEVVIDCNGVGYLCFISVNTSEVLPSQGEECSIHTLLIPKEDALQLFGFATDEEREAFKKLISISGIGPKSALGILSSVSVEKFKDYIISGNLLALQKLPGIGKKTAERLLLGLKDKMFSIGTTTTLTSFDSSNLLRQEAISALTTLGYSRQLAEKAVRQAASDLKDKDLTAEKLIKIALKFAMQ